MKKQLLFLLSLLFVLLNATNVVKAQMMQNGVFTSCNTEFIDDGSFFDYQNSKDYTATFRPTNSNMALEVIFNSFQLGHGDWLDIYSGENTNGTFLGRFSLSSSPGTITSVAPNGALTFVFHSDAAYSGPGWNASVTCTTKKARYYVTTTGNGNGSGWGNTTNLTAALANAQSGDEIWVAHGTYIGGFDTQGKNLKMYGGFQPELNQNLTTLRNPGYYSTLDGESTNRVFTAANGLLLDGFIIQNGRSLSNRGGGGIFFGNGGLLAINNCKFFNNYAKYNGGAVVVDNLDNIHGELNIDRCVFSGNSADMTGGAIFFAPYTIIPGSEKIKITNTLMSGNAATGLNKDSDGFTFNKNFKDILRRHSGSGGAIFFIGHNADLKITNSTIANNSSVKNNDIVSISSPDGMFRYSLYNSIYLDRNATGEFIFINGLNNILGGDPKFEDPISPSLAPTVLGSYILSNCSPAINAGRNEEFPNNITATDLNGNQRFYGQIDIGAYEYQGAPNQNQNILYVDINSTYGQGNADVGSAGNKAIKDLGIALLYASERGCTSEIRVAQGNYLPSTFTREGFFWSKNGYFNITGGYPTGFTGQRDPVQYPTIINGNFQNDGNGTNNSHHLLVLTNNQPQLYGNIIDGFIFENAYADNNTPYNDDFDPNFDGLPQNEGAAIYINNMSPTFNNCVFRQNYASEAGGGIVVNNGRPSFSNCRFEGNTAGKGGAIKINNQSKVNFNNCNFTTNTSNALHGGAVLIDGSSNATFKGSTFNTNVAQYGNGGAIHQENGGSLTLEKNIFKNNAAKYGGAVRLLVGDINFNANANVFTNNTAHENGAGALSIIPGNGETFITNNIFTGNQTLAGVDNQISGGASIVQEGGSKTHVINNTFYNEKAYSGASSIYFKSAGAERYLQNNIFYQNTTTNGNNPPNWNTANGTTATASNNLENTNPLFVNAADPDGADNIWFTADDGLRLQSGSPAINQGISNNATANDILGAARSQDGAIDLGAYETTPSVLPVELISFTAKLENNAAALRWETSSEKDNDSFEIFRSADAKNFVNLGNVAGKGTTNSKSNYTWYDRQPLNGINYYKLVQKDKDGKTEELGIRPLTYSFNGEEVLLYPNPVKQQANVRFTAGSYTSITLSDINGKTIKTIQLNKLETEKSISMDNLANGTYLLRLQGDGKKATVKVIKN